MARAIVLVLVFGATPAFSQALEPDSVRSVARELAASLMSPYCPGRTLVDCQSPGAAALRDEIRKRIERGEPAEAVRADLVRRFGDGISGEPAARGFGLLAWTLPPVLGAAMLGLVALVVRRSLVPSRETPAVITPMEAEMDARVADALAELD